MRGRGAAWVLALVLLAGCAPAPAAEPPEEPEVRVRTHWEALETRAGSLPDVETPWPGGIGEDLIPGEDYGPLYPYAGTVINAAEWEGGPFRYDSLTYGLMTRAGELVTESVYTRVEVPTYYDREGTDVFLPMGTAPFWRWPPGTAAGAPPPGGGPMPPGRRA